MESRGHILNLDAGRLQKISFRTDKFLEKACSGTVEALYVPKATLYIVRGRIIEAIIILNHVIKLLKKEVMQRYRAGWSRLIEAIDKPLGFYVLALLIVEGFLSIILTVSNLSPEAKERGMWAVVGLFLFVVIIVSIIAWCRPTRLTFTELGSLVEMGKVPYGTDMKELHATTPEHLPIGEPAKEE